MSPPSKRFSSCSHTHTLTVYREISGGPWYTDHEFDAEFVNVLSNAVVKFIREGGPQDALALQDCVRRSGITDVHITTEEFSTLLTTLVYDGRLEVHKALFRLARPVNVPNFLSSAPCGMCQVSAQCSPDGVISPATCEYMSAWLGLPTGAELY